MTCCPAPIAADTSHTPPLLGEEAKPWITPAGPGLKRIELMVPGAHCAACISDVERGLKALPGVVDALTFIEHLKTHPYRDTAVGRQVVVIGAGNTAIDVATAAKRLGADTVTIAYRRSQALMPAFADAHSNRGNAPRVLAK